MGRSPCCSKEGLNRRAWTASEDMILSEYIKNQGHGEWKNLPIKAGLNRCGRSCRLRWLNYLRPDIKRGNISPDEVELIIRLHRLLGNRWSLIAGRLPGRTDNEIKNYWNTHLRKKLTMDECQPMNLKTRTESPCDLQNHTFETIPMEAMAARYSEGAYDCNGDSMNSRSHQYCKVSDVEEIRSSCGFVVDDSLRGKDSECIALTVEDTKLVGTEVRNSAWSICNLGCQQLLHSHESVGERATIAESLLDFNIFSPRLHLLSCRSNSSTDILFRKFDTGSPASLAAGTNDIEDLYSVQNNIQHVNSFTIFNGRAGNEGSFDKVQSVDCIHELDYLEEPTEEWLSELFLACVE